MDYITILPEDIDLSTEHAYLRLPHPRTGQPQLYLPSSSNGRERILEVVKINGSKRRTWFIDSAIDSGTMLVHHPIDPLFLVIPLVLSLLSNNKDQIPFQPLSSLVSTVSSSSAHALHAPFTNPKESIKGAWNEDVSRILEMKSVRRVFKLCCERKVVPTGPPSPESQHGEPSSFKSSGMAYYRPSVESIIRLLRVKVDWFAQEERWGCFDHNIRQLGREGLLVQSVDVELVKSARLKTTIEHFAQYLPPDITAMLLKSYDFTAYEAHLANMSAAALAASMPPTNLSGKGDKAAAAGTGAKRKGSSSRGVEALKKVNTASMSKMTSFFKPKEKK